MFKDWLTWFNYQNEPILDSGVWSRGPMAISEGQWVIWKGRDGGRRHGKVTVVVHDFLRKTSDVEVLKGEGSL